MRSRSKFGQLLLAPIAALSWTVGVCAQTPDPKLILRATGSEVAIESRGATLGQILDRLFAERGIPVEWHDEALVGKEIEGSFSGPIDEVMQRLLINENYIASTTGADGKTRISRLIILGRGSSEETVPRPVEAQARRPFPMPQAVPPNALPRNKMPR